MTTTYFLAFDGGTSKTECAISNRQGRIKALVRGGPSNHEEIGYGRVFQVVRDLLASGLSQAGIHRSQIVGACFAMAGVDLPMDQEQFNQHVVRRLDLRCPVMICNDVFAGFRAGADRNVGLCVSEGTGTVFCGRNALGQELLVSMPTPQPLNERLIYALLAEFQGIGPACGFREAFLEALGLPSLEALFLSRFPARDGILVPDWSRMDLARQVIFDPRLHQDPTTVALLKGYGLDLAATLIGIGKRLELSEECFDLVLSGSLLSQGRHPALNETLIRTVQMSLPGAKAVVVDGPPVLGAIRIAQDLVAASQRAVQLAVPPRERPIDPRPFAVAWARSLATAGSAGLILASASAQHVQPVLSGQGLPQTAVHMQQKFHFHPKHQAKHFKRRFSG